MQVDVGIGDFGKRFGGVVELEMAVDVGGHALGIGAAVDLPVHPCLPDAAGATGDLQHVVATRCGLVPARAGDRVDRVVVARIEHAGCTAGVQAQVLDVVRIVDVELARMLEVPLAVRNAIALVEVDARIDVVAVLGHVTEAAGDAGLLFAEGIKTRGGVPGAADFQPLVAALGDDVDDAGHRVGAVHGRRAIGQHFHALDDGGRNGIDVDELGLEARRCAVIRQATAVQQHQRALCAEATQVGLRSTIGTGEQ
ncbi:hypothetical protein D3C81_995860 [compost metagenome]